MSQFTGERLVPEEAGADLWNEHFSRYALAARYCAGKRVLDAGCGTGYGAAHLAQAAERVVAIDISCETIRQARGRYPIANLQFEVATVTAIPFQESSFDVITAFEVIEHLEDWNGLLAEAARLLAPGGVALISTPNREYYTASRGSAGANPFHIHEFEAAEFEAALRAVFPSVTILLQNRTECIAFYPHRVFTEPTASLESASGAPDTAHFFVAICGRAPQDVAATPFVFVPRAANVLREREQHIALLEQHIALLEKQLVEANKQLSALVQAHDRLNTHLEDQNRWALGTAEQLRQAQERIVQVQDEFKAEQERARQVVHDYERVTAELTRRLNETENLLAMTRQSRWVRMGRAVGLGPDLPA